MRLDLWCDPLRGVPCLGEADAPESVFDCQRHDDCTPLVCLCHRDELSARTLAKRLSIRQCCGA